MTIEFSGGGDPARSLSLLWRTQEKVGRGARSKIGVDGIVRAAISIADADGLAALSMRRVAESLEVGTMSLYTYVPGKAELIDLMLDTVYAETDKPDQPESGWRARLEQIARENWTIYRKHPWMLQVGTTRPPLGPNAMRKYDFELGAVAGIGLTQIEMDSVLSLVLGHAEGAARRAYEAASTERETGMTDAQWWQANSVMLTKLMDMSRFPIAAAVGTTVGTAHGTAHDVAHNFEFGLQRILDGIEVFVQRDAEPAETGPDEH